MQVSKTPSQRRNRVMVGRSWRKCDGTLYATLHVDSTKPSRKVAPNRTAVYLNRGMATEAIGPRDAGNASLSTPRPISSVAIGRLPGLLGGAPKTNGRRHILGLLPVRNRAV